MVTNDDVTERILHVTLEIIYLLTGEDYGPRKKSAEAAKHCTQPRLSGRGRSQSSMVVPPTPSLIQERNNDQKILELTNQIIELLSGEVPIRCQDVTVHFSMEEWEYLDGHKDLYKDLMMEDHRPLMSPVESVLSGHSPSHIKEEYVTKDGGHVSDNYRFTATNHSQEDPSPHVKQEILCGGGNLQGTDMCPPTDHTDYITFHIKEEGVLGFEENPSDISKPSNHSEPYPAHHFKGKSISYEGNLTDTCSATDHTQHYPSTPATDHTQHYPSTPATDHTQHYPSTPATDHTQHYPSTHIKEGQVSYDGENLTNVYTPIDHPQQYPPSCQREKLTSIYIPQSHSQYPSSYMKEEPISCEGGDLTEADIYMSSGHPQKDPSPFSKEGEISCDEGNCINTNVYTPTEHVQYTSDLSKDLRKNGLDLQSTPDVFSCSECDKNFHCKSELLMHLPVHSGDKPYNCSICGKCFTNLSYLITHGKIHAGEKRYSCPDCGVSFTRSSNLKAHKRKHTGEKPYLCSDCGKSFSSNSNLNAHRKRHTGDKPYSCPDCGKSFISRSHLVVHQRTHTGEKPYTCPLCIKCFSNTSDLAKHRKIHNKKPYYCSKCGKCYKSNPDFDNQKLHICNS